MPGITRNWAAQNSDKVVGRDGSNSPAGQFSAVNLAFKTSVSEEPPAGRLDSSHSGSSSATGQHGKVFLRLGEPERFRSELIRVKPQAHRLVGMGPRQTQGDYHLNSAIQEFFEIETKAPVGSSQVESREECIQ